MVGLKQKSYRRKAVSTVCTDPDGYAAFRRILQNFIYMVFIYRGTRGFLAYVCLAELRSYTIDMRLSDICPVELHLQAYAVDTHAAFRRMLQSQDYVYLRL